MNPRKFTVMAGLILAAASAARADVVVGTGGWQSWTAATVNENGTPFWDSPSMDGAHQNIGYQILPATPAYYGNSNGTAVASETFLRGTSVGADQGNLLLEIAGYASQNVIGWYDVSNPAVLHTIWTGSNSPTSGAAEAFTPSANWGLYIQGPGGTFYSNSALDSPNDSSQHFAIFELSSTAGAEKYQIGVEDLPYNSNNFEGHGDFNDFVFTIQSTPGNTPFTGGSVPEPASLGILGLGAAGLLLRRRRH